MWSDFLFLFLGFITSHITQLCIKFGFIGGEKISLANGVPADEFIAHVFAKGKGEWRDGLE